jgi:hypothetical protein
MGAKLNVQLEFSVQHCSCGGTYAINEEYRSVMQDNGAGWRCPYCATSWGYFGNSEADRLKKQLAEETKLKMRALADANNLRSQAEKLEADASQARAEAARLKNRSAHGVCPCCTRTFSNLSQHMQSKHPEFVRNETSKVAGKSKVKSSYAKERLAQINGVKP